MAESQNGSRRRGNQETRQRPEEIATLFDQQPPVDINAERGLLGSIFIFPECLDEVINLVSAEDFFDISHQHFFRAFVTLITSNRRAIDSVLLIEHLRNTGMLESVGGAAHVSKLINFVPNAAHFRHYAQIVREKALLRRLIIGCTDILTDAYSGGHSSADMISRAESAIARVSDSAGSEAETREMRPVMSEVMERLERRIAGTEQSTLDVGMTAMSEVMGLVPGGLTVIGGRTSMGKSALCITIARHVARRGGRVYFSTLEMTATEVADRMLSAQSRVDYRRMRFGRNLTPDNRESLVEHAGLMSHWPIHFDDRPGMSVGQIAASCRRLRRRHGTLALIVVDYLQILEPDDRRIPRVEQLAGISGALKRLAREMECPVICAAQVNRGSEENADKKPRLSQLRGSGDIEQDADAVVFVHRPSYYQNIQVPNGQGEEACIIIAKNRNGPVCENKVFWWKEFMSWESMATDFQAEDAPNYEPAFRN